MGHEGNVTRESGGGPCPVPLLARGDNVDRSKRTNRRRGRWVSGATMAAGGRAGNRSRRGGHPVMGNPGAYIAAT
jgi:hypothetical protein